MTKISKGLLTATCALLACCALVGCAKSAPQQEKPFKPEPIRLVLDYTPNTNHTGIYVALDKGFYKDAGLDVSVIQPPEDGADALVASGGADFGVSYQDTMANYLGSKNPLPVSAVAAILQHNTSGIMSAKQTGIVRPKDMAHHSYATWNMPIEQAMIKHVVQKDGAKFSDVKLVPCNTTDEVTSLSHKDFDSIWVFEGWAVQNAKLKNFKYNYFAFADIDPTFDYYTPVLIVNNAYLKKHPETAQKFIDATRKGYEWAAAHPREAADILCKQVPELDRALAEKSQDYVSKYYLDKNNIWGTIDPVRWNRFYEWLNKEHLTERPLQKDAGLNLSLIKTS